MLSHEDTTLPALHPLRKQFVFLLATPEEEYSCAGILPDDSLYHLLHLSRGVNLALMGGEGCNTYPLLTQSLHAENLRQQVQVAAFGSEQRGERQFLDGEAQTCKNV